MAQLKPKAVDDAAVLPAVPSQTDVQAYQSAIEGVSRFTAHALGNPLAGLCLTLDLMANANSVDGARRLLERAQRIADRLGAFKENLAALGGAFERGLVHVDLEPFLQELVASQTAAAAYHLPLRIGKNAPRRLYCHPGLLQQAIEQIIRNATDASPAGGTIGLNVNFRLGFTRITIWDDGPGIPEELQKNLFLAPFSGGKVGGGLGLLLVCRIVKGVHGGETHYERREAGGSEFHLDLPHFDSATL